MNKKVLIICRAFYPNQSPRSFRATELAIEFSRLGYDVTVYAVLGKYNYNNFKEKYNIKLKNLGVPLFSKKNSDEDYKSLEIGNVNKILHRLLKGPLEYPDIELSILSALAVYREKDIGLLISIAVPYPIHWGCALVKELAPYQFPRVWIADCGDPYMGNQVRKKKPYPYFKYVEKWFCKHANYITIPIEEARIAYYEEYHSKIHVIPQGFKYKEQEKEPPRNDTKTFAYAGTFYTGYRDPSKFLEYLVNYEGEYKFIVFTRTISPIKRFIPILKDKLIIKDYMPRDKLLEALCKMDFLINFKNNTSMQSPSKLIDYSFTGRPILALDSNFSQKKIFNEFMQGNYENRIILDNLEKYDIKNVTKGFIKLATK